MRGFAVGVLLCLLLGASPATAAPPAVIDSSFEALVAGRHLDVLEDPEGRLTIGDVSTGEAATRFTPCPHDNNGYGFTGSTYWFRFTTDNRVAGGATWYLEIAYPQLDRVDLYSPAPQDGFRMRSAGDAVPFASREIRHRTLVFPVVEPPGRHMYYLRVQTTSPLNLPLSIFSPRAFEEHASFELAFLWMFYGLMLGLALYNLFIYAAVRDRSYLYYVLWVGSFSLFQFIHNGLAFQHLWPRATAWPSQALLFFAGAGAIAAVLFARSFLGTAKRLPRTDLLFRIFIGFGAAVMLLSFFGLYSLLIRVGALLLIAILFVVLTSGIRLLRAGFRPARWYVAAWSALLVGLIMALLKAFGLLPIHFVTQWGYQIASALEALLLSLALADRINTMRAELKQLADGLETKVEDRTRSLTAANVQLAESNRRLERAVQGRERARAEASQLETDLRQAQKLEAAGKLAGEVGQDVRKVLDDITLSAFKLQEVGEAGDPGRVAVEILAGAQKGRDLASSLLRFSEEEALDRQRVALNAIVEQLGDSLGRSAPREIAVKMRLQPDLAEVEGDAEQLEQMLVRLCRNGLEAMGQSGALTLSTENVAMGRSSLGPYPELKPGMYVRLRVRDTGVGMGPQTLQQAFEPFFTTKTDVEGAGLGLFSVYGTVRRHGGFVTLESEPGQGTTAVVCLPAVEEDA